jgi:arylsulfatase A-like enzyme
MAQKTRAFIHKNKDKPFFLYLPYTGPHVSLQAPKDEVAKYLGQFPEEPYLGFKGGYAPNKYPLATYAAMITYIDTQVGEIFKLLKDLKLDQNTLVLFSSDNGATFDVGGVQTNFFNSVAGFRGRKMDLYEGGIRVPFLARWPSKITAGTVSDFPSVQYDMMATLAQLTGQKPPVSDGISILPTLLGSPQTQASRPFMYFEYPEKTGQVAVMVGDWKGVKSDLKKNKQAPWEIYNVKTDPGETTNVALAHPALVRQMESILKASHRHPHISDWEFIDGKLPVKK